MRKSIRNHFLGTLLVGLIAAWLVFMDIGFASRSRTAQATVQSIPDQGHARSGRSTADVTVERGGREEAGTLRAWYRTFAPGQQVDVRYLPNAPKDFVVDEFWQCYYGSVAGLIVLGVVATAEAVGFVASGQKAAGPSSKLR